MMTLAPLVAALALSAPALPPPGPIDGKTAEALVAAGAVVIDVRTPGEYADGHVPGAKLIPHDQIAARAAELPAKDKPVILYCRSGRRTGIAGEALAKLGYRVVYDLKGLSNWTGPVEKGPAR